MHVHVCAKHWRAGVEAAVNFFGAETRRSLAEAPKKLSAAETPALMCWAHTCTCTTPKMSRDCLNSFYDWRHSLGLNPRSIRTFLYRFRPFFIRAIFLKWTPSMLISDYVLIFTFGLLVCSQFCIAWDTLSLTQSHLRSSSSPIILITWWLSNPIGGPLGWLWFGW